MCVSARLSAGRINENMNHLYDNELREKKKELVCEENLYIYYFKLWNNRFSVIA